MSTTEAVLLLHGQPGAARDWDRVVEAIGERARAIAIDRPGWDGVSAPCGLACNAQAALSALDRAGARSASVVGYSLGGTVAAWLAARHPERVSRLVLLAPAANQDSLVALDHVLAAPLLGELASAAALAVAAVALRARPLLTPYAWGSFVTEQRMLIRELPVLESMLGLIAAPTTIVIGTADWIVPPRSARALARQIRDAQLIEIERASHLLLAQQAARIAEIIVG